MTEEWLDDSIEEGKLLTSPEYYLSGAPVAVKKAKKKQTKKTAPVEDKKQAQKKTKAVKKKKKIPNGPVFEGLVFCLSGAFTQSQVTFLF